MTPADRLALDEILRCVAKVRAYVARAGADWTTDDMALDAIAKRLEEVGELAKRVSPDVLLLMPGPDWRGIKGMREILAHDYGHVQVVIIESTVADDLDTLEAGINGLLGR